MASDKAENLTADMRASMVFQLGWMEHLCIGALITLAVFTGMSVYGTGYFVHDELTCIDLASSGKWLEGYNALNSYKPRFVANALGCLIYRNIGNGTLPLLVVSGLIHALTLFILYRLVTRIFAVPIWLGAFAVMSIALSRFNLYVYAERNLGIIEGLAHLFFVITIYLAIAALNGRRIIAYLSACMFSALCVLSHERFMLILAPIMILPSVFYWRGFTSVFKTLALTGVSALCLSSFVLGSLLNGSASAFSGTAGAKISIVSIQTAKYFTDGIINVFGLNTGEGYLSGNPYHFGLDAEGWMLLLILSLTGLLVLVVAFKAFREFRSWDSNRLLVMAMLGVMIILGCLSASVNFRQEMRWLYAPHLTWICIACFLLGRNGGASRFALLGFLSFALMGNVQSLRGAAGIYMIGQGVEHRALVNFHDASNYVTGKNIIYRGSAHPSIGRYLQKPHSISVVQSRNEIVSPEAIGGKMVLCEFDAGSIRIIPGSEVALDSSSILSESDLEKRNASLSAFDIFPILRFSSQSPQSWIGFKPRRGSTHGGPITEFIPSGDIVLNESQFIHANIRKLFPGHRYQLIASVAQNGKDPSEGHVGIIDEKTIWFTPFAVDPTGKSMTWKFKAPAVIDNPVFIFGHHRLASLALRQVILVDLDG